jgi:predicted GIY-YIG superfamily endonuclease
MAVASTLQLLPSLDRPKRFVYVLQSEKAPDRHYVGLSSDVGARLVLHNAGRSQYTATNRPWVLLAAIEFRNPASAAAFERLLKSGSGRAFAKRHFV